MNFIKQIILNSIFCKFLNNVFITPYSSSLLKQSLSKFKIYFTKSFCYKVFIKYIDKNPYFANAFCYKILLTIASFFKKIVDLFCKAFANIFKTSSIYTDALNFKHTNILQKLKTFSLLIFALALGSLVGSIIFGGNFLFSIILLLISFILYIFNKNINCLKESIVYKIVKYLF